MKKIRPYLIVWVTGVVAGVVMTERWRRTGAYDPAAQNDGHAAGQGTQVAADEPTVAAAIIVGAKSDVQHVWRVLYATWQGTPHGRAPHQVATIGAPGHAGEHALPSCSGEHALPACLGRASLVRRSAGSTPAA